MTENQSFTIDIIRIAPVNAVCYLQAPSIDKSELLNLLQPSEYDYYKQIRLTLDNKSRLIDILSSEDIVQYFQSLEIKNGVVQFVQAYDGMEIGIISKHILVPEWFHKKYVMTEKCIISKDW
jgi:hypothetical protein